MERRSCKQNASSCKEDLHAKGKSMQRAEPAHRDRQDPLEPGAQAPGAKEEGEGDEVILTSDFWILTSEKRGL